MKAIPRVSVSRLTALQPYGYQKAPVCSVHELLRLVRKDPKVTLILFVSGKLLVQTARALEQDVLFELERAGVIDADQKPQPTLSVSRSPNKEVSRPSRLADQSHSTGSKDEIVGSDETLKGDTFGGLVVCAVRADRTVRKKLRAMGVRDSKSMRDEEIRALARKIMDTAPYAVRNLYPEEYNRFSVTALLNRLHAEVNEEVRTDASIHVVDRYPGCTTGDVREERAESLYEEVASASILARYFALRQIAELEGRAGFTIPLGSTHVKHALLKLKASGLPPENFVKKSFRNVREVFGVR